MKTVLAPLAAAALLAFTACASSTPEAQSPESQPAGGPSDTPAATDSGAEMKDLAATAAAAGTFKTLLAALKAAGLEGALQGTDQLTVFAPTDEAFAKLPAGTVDELLKPENKDKLRGILTYHVVPGRVMSGDVSKVTSAKTLNGKDLKVDASGGAVKINEATVTKADIEASNGVIHVIDTVVVPK